MRRRGMVVGPLPAAAVGPVLLALASQPQQRAGDAPAEATLFAPRGQVFHAPGIALKRPVFASTDGEVTAQKVIGSDERERITATSSYPFRVISFLELYDATGEYVGSCTGTFIGPDVLLTAGHCLWSADSGWTQGIVVVPGKNSQHEPFGRQEGTDWWVPDQYIETEGDPLWDWGIIKMNSGTLGNLVGWLSIGLLSTESLEDFDFWPAIIGYPGDKPEGTMWGHYSNSFLQVTETDLTYDIDTAGGESGSAILSINPDAHYYGYIVGVHTLGGANSNSGTRIDRIFVDDILNGCQQMGCSFDYFEEVVSAATPTPTNTPRPTATTGPRATATPIPTSGQRPFRQNIPMIAKN